MEACITQARHLARNLGPSKTTLTHLHLTVRLVWRQPDPKTPRQATLIDSRHDDHSKEYGYKEGSCDLHSEGTFTFTPIDKKVSCPPRMVDVACAAFQILAAAVPTITHLSILGHCSDAALCVFGSNCPLLDSLTVEASSVPPAVLDGLHMHLPKLMHFRMMRRGCRGNSLPGFVEGALFALALCSHLTTLDIDFGKQVELNCSKAPMLQLWQALPHSLLHLRSTAQLSGIRQATSLLMTVQKLDLVSTFSNSVVELLRFVPKLRHFSLQYRAPMKFVSGELLNADGSHAPDYADLQQRLSMVELNFDVYKLEGSYADMNDVMSRILPSIATHISMEVASAAPPNVDFLQHAARAFPNMKNFELLEKCTKHQPLPLVPGLNEALLAKLMDCQYLTQLSLRHRVLWTNAGLARLCMALPRLSIVKCSSSPSLDHPALQLLLAHEKPGCPVNLYSVQRSNG